MLPEAVRPESECLYHQCNCCSQMGRESLESCAMYELVKRRRRCKSKRQEQLQLSSAKPMHRMLLNLLARRVISRSTNVSVVQ